MSVRNKITLIGNAGKDPELHRFDNGNVKCQFSLATNEYYRNKAGERMTDTQWHTVVAWGKLAELMADLIKKGAEVAISGRMTYRSWEQDGQKRYSAEVVAEEFHVMRGNVSEEAPAPTHEPTPDPEPEGEFVAGDDDDLPF